MVNFNIKRKLYGILYPPGVTVIDTKIATALFLILFSTQLTLTTPFSYLPAMVKTFGYEDKDRGYYFGMIASSLFVGRFFGGYFWGWLTDKYGRRPCILISAIFTAVATLAFGFTTNIYWALTTRFLQGLFNGVIVVGRASFAEVCDDTNQAIGVSLVFAAWNSAIVLGPALGGFLAQPVKKYPSMFTGYSIEFFTQFAFLLPSILITIFLLIAIIMVYFVLPETHARLLEEKEKENLSAESSGSSSEKSILLKEKEKPDTFNYQTLSEENQTVKKTINPRNCCSFITESSLFELCRNKYVVLVTIMFGISGFCIIGFSELRSLWMATSSNLGGLSFSTDKIGVALLVPALVATIMQPIVFGRLERKVGGIWTLRITLFSLGLCTAIFPFLHYSHKNDKVLWTFLALIGIVRLISDISSRSCIALFINNVVYKEQAGRANGFAFSVQEIMRVASPTLMGSLFAWSINDQQHPVRFPLDYYFSFFILTLFILAIFLLSYLLPKSINQPKEAIANQNGSVNSEVNDSENVPV